jgi:hypothetical protein
MQVRWLIVLWNRRTADAELDAQNLPFISIFLLVYCECSKLVVVVVDEPQNLVW